MKPANLKPDPLDISTLPRHTRVKIQAMRDNKAQWIQACTILATTGDLTGKAYQAAWDKLLDEIEEEHGSKWCDEVYEKAVSQFNKENEQ